MFVRLAPFLGFVECNRIDVVKLFPSFFYINNVLSIINLFWPMLMVLEIVHATLAVMFLSLIVLTVCSVAQKLYNISAT
jgi:hypothetical protein